MSYHISKTVNLPYSDTVEKVTKTLKDQGFGIVTEIDMKAIFKNKIDKDINPYIILGACNPNYAYEAVQTEERIGTMLPCNVIVRQLGEGKCEVSAIDPVKSMMAVDNPTLMEYASEVRDKLKQAIDAV